MHLSERAYGTAVKWALRVEAPKEASLFVRHAMCASREEEASLFVRHALCASREEREDQHLWVCYIIRMNASGPPLV